MECPCKTAIQQTAHRHQNSNPDYGEDLVPKIRVPKGNTRTRTKIRVWVGLGLCLNSMGIFGLGTHKVQNFGFFWVLPLGTQEYWVPKI